MKIRLVILEFFADRNDEVNMNFLQLLVGKVPEQVNEYKFLTDDYKDYWGETPCILVDVY
jgi:hypothetical protein